MSSLDWPRIVLCGTVAGVVFTLLTMLLVGSFGGEFLAVAGAHGAAVAVGIAWWMIAGIQSLKWVLLLGIPLSACLPLAANLVPAVIAVFVGAALFGRTQPA